MIEMLDTAFKYLRDKYEIDSEYMDPVDRIALLKAAVDLAHESYQLRKGVTQYVRSKQR